MTNHFTKLALAYGQKIMEEDIVTIIVPFEDQMKAQDYIQAYCKLYVWWITTLRV